MSTWIPFAIGSRHGKSGSIEILALINWGPTQDETRYQVQHTCCGGQEERTHTYIAVRDQPSFYKKRRFPDLCQVCAHRARYPEVKKSKKISYVGKPYLPTWYIHPGDAWQRPLGIITLMWGDQF